MYLRGQEHRMSDVLEGLREATNSGIFQLWCAVWWSVSHSDNRKSWVLTLVNLSAFDSVA